MIRRLVSISVLLIMPMMGGTVRVDSDWGFYAHRSINRLAVFTLPPELMILYKPNIEYIAQHAVDPDKRRYASSFEAVRHYIDLDHWGSHPYPELPRNWVDALMKFGYLKYFSDPSTFSVIPWESLADTADNGGRSHEACREFFRSEVLPGYYEDQWTISCDTWTKWLGSPPTESCWLIEVVDSLSPKGILPYHLVHMQQRLTEAFMHKNIQAILRLSTDMGHYIGDGHVPLHTTSNYNGQLTDQLGIHAFWESRIPELFATDHYDLFSGKADYISNKQQHYWDMVLDANQLVDSVLSIEKTLSQRFPSDQQFCFDTRLDVTIRTQCRAYAKAYQEAMQGMVERQMRASVRAIGSAWYTAWVDAGQPAFGRKPTEVEVTPEAQDEAMKRGRTKIRAHE